MEQRQFKAIIDIEVINKSRLTLKEIVQFEVLEQLKKFNLSITDKEFDEVYKEPECCIVEFTARNIFFKFLVMGTVNEQLQIAEPILKKRAVTILDSKAVTPGKYVNVLDVESFIKMVLNREFAHFYQQMNDIGHPDFRKK